MITFTDTVVPFAPSPHAPLGEPPVDLPAAKTAIWRELAAECPPRILGASDRQAFAQLVHVTFLKRTATAAGRAPKRTLLRSLNLHREQFFLPPITVPAKPAHLSSRVRVELRRISATFDKVHHREPTATEIAWLTRFARASAAFTVAMKQRSEVGMVRSSGRMATAARRLGLCQEGAR